jgi:hypothetical protein
MTFHRSCERFSFSLGEKAGMRADATATSATRQWRLAFALKISSLDLRQLSGDSRVENKKRKN